MRRPLVGLLVVLMLVLPLAACGEDHSSQPRPPFTPLNPAAVAQEMGAAMSSWHTLSATMGGWGPVGLSLTGTFMCDAAGDYSKRWFETPGEAQRTQLTTLLSDVYDARRHVLLSTYRETDGGLKSDSFDDLWPYEDPMAGPGWATGFAPGQVWWVRAALAEGDPGFQVSETVFDGRPAWRVAYDRNPDVEGESIVIDRETGFLVAYETPEQEDGSYPEGVVSSLTGLRVDEALPADAFRAVPPPGARLERVASGDFYCRLDAVAYRAGFRPFTPAAAAVPSGYRLSEVATDGRCPFELVGGWCEPQEQGAHRTEFLRYRNGFNSFTIQIASMRGQSRSEMRSSLKPLPGWGDVAAEKRMLLRGSFAGCTAQTWLNSFGANLIVVGDRYVAYLTGSLTRPQLYALAEGLRQR